MTSIWKKLQQFIIRYWKVGPTKSLTVVWSRQLYLKRIPYKQYLVTKIRKIYYWSSSYEKTDSSGRNTSSYNPNWRWAHTEHVSVFASLEPHDIRNNAEFRMLNVQLTNKGYMTNEKQTLTLQVLF
jgi:hypothetical protein